MSEEKFSLENTSENSTEMSSFYKNAAEAGENGYKYDPTLFEIEEGKNEKSDDDTGEQNSEQVPVIGAFQEPATPDKSKEDEDEGDNSEEGSMTLIGHLNEIRHRLFRIIIALILGFFACYGVSEEMYAYISTPLTACLPEGSKMIFTSPQGAFFTYMKVSLVASLFGTSPYSFYQIWAFIAPGLYKEEKKAIKPLALFSALFFIGGACFCYFLVFPIAMKFFMTFATDTIVPMISVEEYLSLALKLLIAFGVVFEMPLFAYFLAKFGILSPAFLRSSRKYAILIIFIVAAILTPPDVFSQIMMAIPMIILYEISIFIAISVYPKKTEQKNTEKDLD